MADFMLGLIIVSFCIGILNGAVYGWMFFGVVLMMSGLLNWVFSGKKS